MDNDIIFFHKLEEMKIINSTTLRDTLDLFLFLTNTRCKWRTVFEFRSRAKMIRIINDK